MDNGNRLYICGTNAHNPKDYVIYVSFFSLFFLSLSLQLCPFFIFPLRNRNNNKNPLTQKSPKNFLIKKDEEIFFFNFPGHLVLVSQVVINQNYETPTNGEGTKLAAVFL
jgi:hypothetical protein